MSNTGQKKIYNEKELVSNIHTSSFSVSGAGGGGRTRTVLPPRDFESRTSANSITPA